MSAVLSGYREMNLESRTSVCQSTWKVVSITLDNQIEALIILMLIKDVDNGGMLATFGFLYPEGTSMCDRLPYKETTCPKLQKFPSQSLTVGNSRKRPPPISYCDHVSGLMV